MPKVILNDELSNDPMEYWTGYVDIEGAKIPFYATPDQILIGESKYLWPAVVSSVIDAVLFCSNS